MNSDIRELTKKLEKGELTEAEMDALFKSVNNLPVDEANVVMAKLWEHCRSYPDLETRLSHQMYHRIRGRIELSQKVTESYESKPKHRRLFIIKASAAAILVILTALGWFWMTKPVPVTYKTSYAEQQEHTLPDGSRVILNANSTMRFHKEWEDDENRMVWLEGEAFFEVEKKASGQKFQVVTQDLTVEVLGTSFNVNSHHSTTKVYLQEGSIALALDHHQENRTMMNPGDLVRYSTVDKETVIRNSESSQNPYTSWKDGVLSFDNTPLREVFLKIEEIYGIRIQVNKVENLERKITTGLPMDELSKVLPMLEKAMNLEVTRVDDIYIIQ